MSIGFRRCRWRDEDTGCERQDCRKMKKEANKEAMDVI